MEGAVRGARQVSSGARSRLACPQVPRPCGIHGCSPVMSLKFGYSYSFLPTRLATPWFFICSAGAQVSIGNARRALLGCLPGSTHLGFKRENCPCRASATPEPGAWKWRRDIAWGPAGILGCPVSPCMSTSAPALRYPWLLAGDVVEVWVWLQCSNDAARDAMVLYLQCRDPSVHRQRLKVTLGCLPGPTHLRTKRCNCPCRASAMPEAGK